MEFLVWHSRTRRGRERYGVVQNAKKKGGNNLNELINGDSKWEHLVNYISPKNYGDIVYHSEIETVVQEHRANPKSKYFSIIAHAKKDLLERGKLLKSIPGQGYRVVRPGEFAQEAVGKYRSGFNRIKQGKKILEYAPTKDMTEEERQDYRNVSDRANLLHASMAGGVVELKLLAKQHPLLNAINKK